MPNNIIITLSIIIPVFLLIVFLISLIIEKIREVPYEEEFINIVAQGLYEGQSIQFKSFPITTKDHDMERFFMNKEIRSVVIQNDKLLFMYVLSLNFILEQVVEEYLEEEYNGI